MSHTPGPWAAHEGWPSDVWHVDMPGRAYSIGVSRADSDDDMTVEEVQANARLIAAAPDLLATCKALAHDIRAMQFTDGEYRLSEDSARQIMALLDREISKATGGE
jgi:hypothetical protein